MKKLMDISNGEAWSEIKFIEPGKKIRQSLIDSIDADMRTRNKIATNIMRN